MTDPLLTRDADPVTGTFCERENRFVVTVDFGDDVARAYLGDPGALRNVLVDGAELLCEPVDDPDRATDYDAIAARVGDHQVSLRAALANDLFAAALEAGHLPQFDWADAVAFEPPLPDHGRADVRLESAAGDRTAFVEVKSCTHVDDGVARFPDRPTERGRRHLRSLEALHGDGTEAHLVFVVQHPAAERVRPFREVDPEFADLLARVADAGVSIHALVTAFDPPHYHLVEADLPVELEGPPEE
jgi:sugar fermentation stimulation protein A